MPSGLRLKLMTFSGSRLASRGGDVNGLLAVLAPDVIRRAEVAGELASTDIPAIPGPVRIGPGIEQHRQDR
jgi:hypothetical protein